MVSSPSKSRRRSISAAAKPAAPPPMMTIRRGGSARRRAASPDRCGVEFSPDHDELAAAFDAPAGQRIESGRGERLAGAQAEAGVMPGAPHGLADHDTVGERRAVMGALCANR